MKYINKKLPLIPINEELNFVKDIVSSGVHCFGNGTLHCTEETFNKLLSEGWIEEVKPREWWISETVVNDLGNRTIEKIYAFETRKDLIKVREVIE